MKKMLAHISEDGREQTIEEHLEGTAQLCSAFAKAFGAETQGYLAGSAHDIGKYSEAFQRRLQGGSTVDHATAGAKECAQIGAEQVACCIIGHHGGLPDVGNSRTDQRADATFFGRLKRGIAGGIEPYSAWPGHVAPISPPDVPPNGTLALSYWTRMLYSCLVDADYLDTERFMTNGTITRDCHDTLPTLLDRLEKHVLKWSQPRTDLNRYRCEILQSCLDGAAQSKGLFTLTVPTGGGKTIASLAFALRHAVRHQLRRVIYVIPYTSIIEQNAAVFRDILGDGNVVEHHSGVSFDPEENASPEDYRQALAAENWDAPVIVTTAVQFFESLYANRPSQCRKLHNIANSVIIFDEAQMIPTPHLRPCVAGIAALTTQFGASAVLCTATQPALNDLFSAYGVSSIRELSPRQDEIYERFRRVSFHNSGMVSDDALAAELSKLNQVLCIVNSRKAAQALYERLPAEGSFHLSTLMYPAHRHEILAEIRTRLHESLPCRVISTSLIEAGVDVSFPAVYREMAGLDSILQAAGRCNREGKYRPEASIVTIFTRTEAPPLFRVHIGAAKEALAAGGALDAPHMMRRYFSAYRALAGNNLDKSGVIRGFQQGIEGCGMPFRTIAQRFHLIDQDTKTLYIPLGEGAQYAQQLMDKQYSKYLYQQAGRYAVNLYPQHVQALLCAGDAQALDEDSAVLLNLALYREKTGLSLQADWGKELFI